MLQKRNQNATWKFVKSIEVDGTGEFDVLEDGRVFMQFKCTNCGNIHTVECGDSLPEICNICNSDMKNINGAKYHGTSKWNYNGHNREYYNNDPDMGKELIFSCDICGGMYTTNNRTLLPKMCSRCNSKMENWVEGLIEANEIVEAIEKNKNFKSRG